eukprot:jgi/Chlat1/7931/Chrsp68S07383
MVGEVAAEEERQEEGKGNGKSYSGSEVEEQGSESSAAAVPQGEQTYFAATAAAAAAVAATGAGRRDKQQLALEEALTQVQALHDVNRFLNCEIERLTSQARAELYNSERAQLMEHAKRLGDKLHHERTQASGSVHNNSHTASKQQTDTDGKDDEATSPLKDLEDTANGGDNGDKTRRAPSHSRRCQPQLYSQHMNVAVEEMRERGRRGRWLIDPSEVRLGSKIAEGGTAVIHKGKWRGLEVAIKVAKASVKERCKAQLELSVLSSVRHPNLVQFLGACLEPGSCMLLTELMKKGTVKQWLHEDAKWIRSKPSLGERLHVALDVARGMQYLHSHSPSILHRDLKSSNVYMDSGGSAKIGDFGFSRFLPAHSDFPMTGETGTYQYMAPEVIRHDAYSTQADVYSYAVLLCELVAGEAPYSGLYLTALQIAMSVAKDPQFRPVIPKHCPPAIEALLKRAWSDDPHARPSFEEITPAVEHAHQEASHLKGQQSSSQPDAAASKLRWIFGRGS